MVRKKRGFRYDVPFSRNDIVRRGFRGAQATARAVTIADINSKKHLFDELLMLFNEDWLARIFEASGKGTWACPLEYHLLTDEVMQPKVIREYKEDLETRISEFFESSGFKLLKFENWVLERDRIGVMLYIKWS